MMTIERLEELRRDYDGYFGFHEPDIVELIDAEIERQSVTDDDVKEAIEYLKPIARHPITANRKHLETAITALERINECDSCKAQMDFVKEHTLANDLFRELQETKDTLEKMKRGDK